MDDNQPAIEAQEGQNTLQEIAQLYAKNPRLAQDVLKIAMHEPNTASEVAADIPCLSGRVDPYITNAKERWHLLMDFSRLQQQRLGITYLDALLVALFMVLPLSQVKRIVENADADEENLRQYTILADWGMRAVRSYLTQSTQSDKQSLAPHAPNAHGTLPAPNSSPLAPSTLKRSATTADVDDNDTQSPDASLPRKLRKQGHRRSQSDTAAQVPETPPPRSMSSQASPSSSTISTNSIANSIRRRNAVAETKARDAGVCILTGVNMPDAAHIFPFSVAASSYAKFCLETFFTFWGEETKEKWKALFRDKNITESPKNLISLAKHMHLMWDKGFFALKPLSVSAPGQQPELVVQFHWLKRHRTRPAPKDLHEYDTAITAMSGGDTDILRWGAPLVAHRRSGVRIQTGQLFTIRADTPEQLPSFELLQLQWDMMRISAMCGAADVYDDEYNDDDSDEALSEDAECAVLDPGDFEYDIGDDDHYTGGLWGKPRPNHDQELYILRQLGVLSYKLTQARISTIASAMPDSKEPQECLSLALTWHERYSLDNLDRGLYLADTSYYEAWATAVKKHVEELAIDQHMIFGQTPSSLEYDSMPEFRKACLHWDIFIAEGDKLETSSNRFQFCLASQWLCDVAVPKMQIQANPPNFAGGFPLQHTDLHTGNIFVDDNITIILPASSTGPAPRPFPPLRSWPRLGCLAQ
ncbi:hypothetical protein SBRCBS47491_006944 [Sporothrix bragantina]|uniref:HNH nuclease domain-containing protein n=1 Tax=Sporothrix bragantina TaxID=671064 RepID=A0ABP0C968_9PEZI